MAAAKIIKKLSMKHLVGNVAALIPTREVTEERNGKTYIKDVPAIGETAWIANVVGIARDIKSGVSTYGDWTALIGDFVAEPIMGPHAAKDAVAAVKEDKAKGIAAVEAVPAKEVTRFRSGQLFLPDVVLLMVEAALGGNEGVEFAFKIGITAAATDGERPSQTGYEYTADFLVAPKSNDPLENLIAAALPAPEALGKEVDPETGEIKK